MPKRGTKTLPPEVRRQLDKATEQIERVLWMLVDGDDPEVVAELAFVLNEPLRAAQRLNVTARREAGRSNVLGREVDFGMVVATHIRSLRQEAAWTQDQLAKAMQRIGYDWKRITVAEIEAGADRKGEGRKVTLEELLALTCLFGVPLVEFLLPDPFDHLTAPTVEPFRVRRAFLEEGVRELVLGEGGSIGRGGPDWSQARGSVMGDESEDWRPAVELWRSRKERGKA